LTPICPQVSVPSFTLSVLLATQVTPDRHWSDRR